MGRTCARCGNVLTETGAGCICAYPDRNQVSDQRNTISRTRRMIGYVLLATLVGPAGLCVAFWIMNGKDVLNYWTRNPMRVTCSMRECTFTNPGDFAHARCVTLELHSPHGIEDPLISDLVCSGDVESKSTARAPVTFTGMEATEWIASRCGRNSSRDMCWLTIKREDD